MLRKKIGLSLMQQKPRKMLKLDKLNQKRYNEFQGNSQIDEQETFRHQQTMEDDNQHKSSKNETNKDINIQQEIQQNQKIYQLIARDHSKYRRVGEGQLGQKIQNDNKKIQSDNKKKLQLIEITKALKKQQKLLSSSSVKPSSSNVKLEQGQQHLHLGIKNQQKIKKQQKGDKKQQKIDLKLQKQKVNASQKNKLSKSQQKPQQIIVPSSNWQKFLSESPNTAKTISHFKGTTTVIGKQVPSQYIALDCQFVKCDQQQHLARISIVSQNGVTLYDSYIKPQQKVTDFISEITGITYSHIKNAPKWSEEQVKIKKMMMGKILVGHTIHKDLQVMKMTDWKGVSQKVDIAEFSLYKDKGGSKVVGLKRLTATLLNRNIQAGWHSSVEDAVATMELFRINKKKILQELKII